MTDSVADAALVVARWLAAVFDHADLTSAWPLTDEPLRLALAQSWVMPEGDRVDVAACNRDVLACALAEADQPASPFWPEFSGWRIIRWREVLPDFVTDAGIRGTVSGEHPEAPDVEAVWIAHRRAAVPCPPDRRRLAGRRARRGAPGAGVAAHRVTPTLTGNAVVSSDGPRRCSAEARHTAALNGRSARQIGQPQRRLGVRLPGALLGPHCSAGRLPIAGDYPDYCRAWFQLAFEIRRLDRRPGDGRFLVIDGFQTLGLVSDAG